MIVSVIPARGGSKGIPRKNLIQVGGMPLIYWSIDVSLRSICDRTIVSTEDSEIYGIAEDYGAEVVLRPMELSADSIQTEPVVASVINTLGLNDDDGVVLLQPTSPVRTVEMLDYFISVYDADIKDEYADAVFTAHPDHYYHWHEVDDRWECTNSEYMGPRLPRQEYGHRVKEFGSIYITSARNWVEHNRFGTDPSPIVVDSMYGIELDEEWQIPILSLLLEEVHRGS